MTGQPDDVRRDAALRDAEAIVTHLGEQPSSYFGAVVPPIFQNSLFVFDTVDAMGSAFERVAKPGEYLYSRESNPTTTILEEKIAALEGGEAARCFGSGMAAISAAILSCVGAGKHVVCIEHVYGETRQLLTQFLPRFGVETTFVEGSDPAGFERASRPNTSLYYIESPSTAVFGLQDIAAITSIAKSRGISVAIDNSWASPIFQKPLSLGCDLVLHSVTKYLSGHSDLLAGCIVGSRERIDAIAASEAAILGGMMPPFEAWLVMRGLRTLPIRMREAMARGLVVAQWLESHPKVARVNHPWLPSHPQHELAVRQMTGSSSLFSFDLKDWNGERVADFVESLKFFQLGVSWGGHESLVTVAGAPGRKDMATPHPIRLMVGMEPTDALIADLEEGLRHV